MLTSFVLVLVCHVLFCLCYVPFIVFLTHPPPNQLHSHHYWSTEVHIWDIIGEVVKLCMYPAPRNPFAVDMDYFLSLSTHQQLLPTAAMMVCLQKIVLHTSDDRRYAGKGRGVVTGGYVENSVTHIFSYRFSI